MTRREKVLRRVLSGTADQTIRFGELCALLTRHGFDQSHRGGSHHIFTSSDDEDNLRER